MSFRWPEIKLPGSTKRKPEDSIELRAWVLAAVLVGEAAVLTSGYFGAVTSVLVPFLTVVAFVVSYRRRRERNIILKVMLAFGALAALAMFFREVLSSLYDTRVPLARLFLWVQVIHAFDLPARKDLSYSLVSGLILVAVGAVLSTSLWYGLFVLAFLFCAMGAMTQMNLSEARERAGLQASRSRGLVVGTVVPCFFAVVAVGLVCFSLLPQRQAMNLTMMPTSAFRNVGENFTGGVQNPYYRPPGGDPFAGPPQAILSDSYHGFQPYMDLRSRGRLSDEVVMKVRSEETVPYRGVAFDNYNGKGWEISTGDTAEKLTSNNLRFDTFTATNTESEQAVARRRPGLSYREGLPQHHLRRLPSRDGLLPDEHHQDRPIRLPQGALPDPRRLGVLGHLQRPERFPRAAQVRRHGLSRRDSGQVHTTSPHRSRTHPRSLAG
jgi:hypothetical protein